MSTSEGGGTTNERQSGGCCCSTSKNNSKLSTGSESLELEPEDEELHRLTFPLEEQLTHKNIEISNFVWKTILVKVVQFLLAFSYILLMFRLENAFSSVSMVWITIPGLFLLAISVLARVIKTPPHFSITLLSLLISCLSVTFIFGTAFQTLGYYSICFPVSFLFINVTYLIMLLAFYFKCVTMEASYRKYHLIPLSIIWFQNTCLLGCLLFLPLKPSDYKFEGRVDMTFIICFPTIFWSSIFTWLSMKQLRDITDEQWFYVVYDPEYHDHLYAALYMV